MRKGDEKMFKAYDYVVGEIVEAETLRVLINALQDRWEDYIAAGRNVSYACINGVRYIAEK